MRLRLKLRLRAMLAVMLFARLMLVALLIGLAVALMVARIVVARLIRLLLDGDKARLLPETRKAFLLVAFLRCRLGIGPRLRLILTELLLGCGDQTEIMLGMLIVVLGGDRIAGRARIARKLHIFFCDVRGGAADLDVRSIGLKHPGHRVLATPVAIISIVITVTHPLVLVLTVSHVVPLFQP